MQSIQKIAVIGAGALGAVYASRIHEADAGAVVLIAAGERARRLRQVGLVVNDRIYRLPVADPGAKPAPVDLVIVAVKHHHLSEAIRDMQPFVGAGTAILSVMNGIDSETLIGAALGQERMLYAVAVGIDAVRETGRITYSTSGKILFGEARNATLSERVQRVRELLTGAGIDCETPEDMRRVLWWKFMINVGLNQASAVLRASYGLFQTSPEAWEVVVAAMQEVLCLADAAGVHLRAADIDNFRGVLSGMSAAGKTSMLQDVEAHRKTEVEMFAGKVIALGREYGIPTPVNQTLFRLIRAMESSW